MMTPITTDEAKKRVHDSQIVQAKRIKLSQGEPNPR